jgi:hypothetical protein
MAPWPNYYRGLKAVGTRGDIADALPFVDGDLPIQVLLSRNDIPPLLKPPPCNADGRTHFGVKSELMVPSYGTDRTVCVCNIPRSVSTALGHQPSRPSSREAPNLQGSSYRRMGGSVSETSDLRSSYAHTYIRSPSG